MYGSRLLSVAALVSASLLFAACDSNEEPEVIIEDLVVGEGTLVEEGQCLSVHYTGWFEDGDQFDTSRGDGGAPFAFRLGARQVIRGWDEGIPGMRIGGTRRLTIPPELGYGNRWYFDIPPNSTLIFEVEVLEALAPPQDSACNR